MNELIPNKRYAIKSCDDKDQIPLPQYRRGHAGVAAVWDPSLDDIMHPLLDEGNERLLVLGVGKKGQPYEVLFINSYMPAGNSIKEIELYRETLDSVFEVTQKFIGVERIIWIGDLNGSLTRDKPCERDRKLREFCSEVGYVACGDLAVNTYYHNNHLATSRIDHILTYGKDLGVTKVEVQVRHHANTSTHDPLSACISLNWPREREAESSRQDLSAKDRIQWGKVDIERYKELTAENLRVVMLCAGEDCPPEILIDRINTILYEAALSSSTQRFGHKKKAKRKHHVDPLLVMAIKDNRAAFWEWKCANRPMDKTSPLHIKMIRSKKQLRQIQRQLEAVKRKDKISRMMDASPRNQSLFYSIVRGQRCSDNITAIDFGGTVCTGSDLLHGWATYFEKLATPIETSKFCTIHRDSVEVQNIILEDKFLQTEGRTWCQEIQETEVIDMLKGLKINKAPDMWGISSEHLKYADTILIEMLKLVINNIIVAKRIPSCLKRGVITPVYKGKGDRGVPDNYRRITVTSLVGKLIEKVLVKPTKEILSPNLNNLQRGFSTGSSSVNTSLLVTEACAEARDQKIPLYAALLDASKAFDVVWHQGMFVKLSELGITEDLWLLYKELYDGMSSAVKWDGSLSPEFTEFQGVRQGGIPSTELFKARGDALLHRMEQSMLGFSVGSIDISVPTCADDMILLSSSAIDLQAMIDIAAHDASLERYQYSTKKTKSMVFKSGTRQDRHIQGTWSMEGMPVETVSEDIHLGIVRSSQGTSTATVQNNITKARRALYSLMNSGLHGLNGVHPAVSLKLWNAYVLPRLTFGLEQAVCTTANIELLELFQRKTFKRIQHLPPRTSNSAVLLLLGELPVQATIDKNTIMFFTNILDNKQTKECQLIHRQLAMKSDESGSWVVYVTKMLRQYDLPSAHFLWKNPPGRADRSWRKQVYDAVWQYWMNLLLRDISHKISTKYICRESIRLRHLHPVWSETPYDQHDILQACVKVKMLSGVYWLKADDAKRRQREPSDCPMCDTECAEDLSHVLVRCEAYSDLRTRYFILIHEAFEKLCGVGAWQQSTWSDEEFVNAILDPSLIKQDCPYSGSNRTEFERVTRRYVYSVHTLRAARLQ